MGIVQKGKESKEGGKNEEDIMTAMQGQMQYIFPIMTALITLRLPAGVGLYWLVSVVFSIIQQRWTHKQ